MVAPAQAASPPPELHGLTPPDVVQAWRTMYLSRRLDDREIALKRQNRIYFQISGAGHEAILLATGLALRPGYDWAIGYYRDRALMLALGMTARESLLAAVGSTEDTTSKGRQMPNHWSFPALNVFCKSSCTGTQFLQGVGGAEAGWYADHVEAARPFTRGHRPDDVTVITTGDGTTSEGEFWEALNTASNKKLPCIFLVEDNGYAISVPVEVQTAGGSVSDLVANFPDLHIERVDGCDLFESLGAMRRAVAYCRERKGPALVHAKVIRPYSHSLSDDEQFYRTKAERAAEAERDPIDRLARTLVAAGWATEERLAALRAEVDAEVDAATEYALAAPTPEPPEVLHYIYSAETDPTGPAFESAPTFEGDDQTMVDLINACLRDEMARDPRIVVFGEDVADASRPDVLGECKGKGGVFKVTHGLQKRYSEHRVFNTPLAEANIIGRAIGMASRGLKPVVEIQFLDYIWPAYQQIRHPSLAQRRRLERPGRHPRAQRRVPQGRRPVPQPERRDAVHPRPRSAGGHALQRPGRQRSLAHGHPVRGPGALPRTQTPVPPDAQPGAVPGPGLHGALRTGPAAARRRRSHPRHVRVPGTPGRDGLQGGRQGGRERRPLRPALPGPLRLGDHRHLRQTHGQVPDRARGESGLGLRGRDRRAGRRRALRVARCAGAPSGFPRYVRGVSSHPGRRDPAPDGGHSEVRHFAGPLLTSR
jgi:TPP-dependent pyruvate/acetoin dehydrogenase alpha subunit